MADLIENPDGSLIQDPGAGYRNYPPLDHDVPSEAIDPLFLAQMAAANVLMGQRAWIYDGEALVRGERRRTALMRVARINIDWPKSEADLEGAGEDDRPIAVTIVEGGQTRPDEDFGGGFFAEGARIDERTVAEVAGTAEVELEVHCICTHTDERRAVRSMLWRAFTVEPSSEAHGRAVVVPIDNLHTSVSFELEGMRNDDNPQDAHENLRAVTAYLSAQVPVIHLTAKPATLDVRNAGSLV